MPVLGLAVAVAVGAGLALRRPLDQETTPEAGPKKPRAKDLLGRDGCRVAELYYQQIRQAGLAPASLDHVWDHLGCREKIVAVAEVLGPAVAIPVAAALYERDLEKGVGRVSGEVKDVARDAEKWVRGRLGW